MLLIGCIGRRSAVFDMVQGPIGLWTVTARHAGRRQSICSNGFARVYYTSPCVDTLFSRPMRALLIEGSSESKEVMARRAYGFRMFFETFCMLLILVQAKR